MKKGLLIVCAALMLIMPASGSRAAMIELAGLPSALPGGDAPGSLTFDVNLVDMGSLPNIDGFTVGLQISGAAGLELPETSVAGDGDMDYVFAANAFGLIANNPNDDMSRVVFSDVTGNGTGVENAADRLLGRISLSYPQLTPGTVLTFSLIDGESFLESDSSTGYQVEELVLTGQTTIPEVPLPGAIWIMGGGLLALLRFRRSR
jgi:hypothetical protein